MAKVLLLGDIHLSEQPPSTCTASYQDDLFALLGETVKVARQHNVAAAIWAGDVFHHKAPSRTSHSTVRRLIDLARTYPCPVYVVAGNHDLSHDRLDSVEEGQPLGVMAASGAIQLLRGFPNGDSQPEQLRSVWLYGVPWLGRFDDERVAAALADWRDRRGEANSTPGLVVAHAPLYPPGQELAFEYYPTRNWSSAMGGAGSVYYGHVHEPHGVYTVDGVTYANPGALSRGSLHEHNLKRAVTVAVWDSTTGEFDLTALPHRPAAEIFRLDQARELGAAKIDLDRFLESVAGTNLDVLSIEAVLAHLQTLGLEPDVYELAAELLSGATA